MLPDIESIDLNQTTLHLDVLPGIMNAASGGECNHCLDRYEEYDMAFNFLNEMRNRNSTVNVLLDKVNTIKKKYELNTKLSSLFPNKNSKGFKYC